MVFVGFGQLGMVAGRGAGGDVDEALEAIELAGGVERVHGAEQVDFDDPFRLRQLAVTARGDGGGMNDLRNAVFPGRCQHAIGVGDIAEGEDDVLDRMAEQVAQQIVDLHQVVRHHRLAAPRQPPHDVAGHPAISTGYQCRQMLSSCLQPSVIRRILHGSKTVVAAFRGCVVTNYDIRFARSSSHERAAARDDEKREAWYRNDFGADASRPRPTR